MPTIKRFGTLAIKMYADDHHPPHFHLVSAEHQVLVRISDLAVLEGRARPGWGAEALEWAGTNRDELMAIWQKLNERG